MNNSGIEIAGFQNIGIALLFTIPIIAFFWFLNRKSRSILETWAKENSFELLHFRQSAENPFGLTSRGQTIYSVRVRDHAGNERSGWVRCGSFGGGVLFGDKADVKWEDDAA